ncbi:hypothetical protein CEXT_447671 [Caerostris extrusa]|uniref:Uncharacterized protein n=1 Tax=Caerostris extrusa TaxID=172846 RepID=A0AAV4URG2_CAEEX|nr:hypothetical protein CEXT_447671 [Caerostris extrusa]
MLQQAGIVVPPAICRSENIDGPRGEQIADCGVNETEIFPSIFSWSRLDNFVMDCISDKDAKSVEEEEEKRHWHNQKRKHHKTKQGKKRKKAKTLFPNQ